MQIHIPYLIHSFLLSILLIHLLKGPASELGLVDSPAGRKMHNGQIPLIGGLSIFVVFLLESTLLEGPFQVPIGLLCGLTLLVLIGVLDDWFNLPASFRLIAQVASAIVMLAPDEHAVASINLYGLAPIELGQWALPFTVVFVVGMINAFNMLDGLDGLAGGAAATALFWLSIGYNGYPEQPLLLILLCAVVGFLLFNLRHPWRAQASVFLGDAGSTMLGAAIAFFIVVRAGSPASENNPFAALLWIIAIPAIDTLSLIVRRLATGQNPLAADRNHLHHLLLGVGLSHRNAAAVILAACFLTGGAGVMAIHLGVPSDVMLISLVIPAALHTGFTLYVSRRRHPRIDMAKASTEANGA
jgi:UDP-GlcNAc:undecaprenyl-phosphate GlcNAc-1-phosphate transferase